MSVFLKPLFVSSLALPLLLSCAQRTPRKPAPSQPTTIQKKAENKSSKPFSCFISQSEVGKETVFRYKKYYLGTSTLIGILDSCEPMTGALNQAYAQGLETKAEGTLSIEVDKSKQSLRLSYNGGEAVSVNLNQVVQPTFE